MKKLCQSQRFLFINKLLKNNYHSNNKIIIYQTHKALNIIHQNIQLLGNTIDKLNYILKDHKDCKVLCVSEQ